MEAVKSVVGPVLVSLALVGTLGVVHGICTDRWGPSGQLQRAVAALDRVPATFGDWVGEDVPTDPEGMARGGIKGWLSRRHQNTRTRETVSVLVVCGRGGPISVHTPDVCYTAGGYRQLGDATTKEVVVGGDAKHTFRVARFGKPGGVSQGQLEIYWAWSRDGRVWEAPDNPRTSFARSPALYKLYVVRDFVPGGRADAADPCQDFLRRALPEFRTALNPTEG